MVVINVCGVITSVDQWYMCVISEEITSCRKIMSSEYNQVLAPMLGPVDVLLLIVFFRTDRSGEYDSYRSIIWS